MPLQSLLRMALSQSRVVSIRVSGVAPSVALFFFLVAAHYFVSLPRCSPTCGRQISSGGKQAPQLFAASSTSTPRLAIVITGLLSNDEWRASFGPHAGFDFARHNIVRILVADALGLDGLQAEFEAAGIIVVALLPLEVAVPQEGAAHHPHAPDYCCGPRASGHNRQRWFVWAGVLRAQQLGATHVLRTRTDVLVTDFARFNAALQWEDPQTNVTFLHWFATQPAFHSDFVVLSSLADARALWCGLARESWDVTAELGFHEAYLQERYIAARGWRRREWCAWSRTLYSELPRGLVFWGKRDVVSDPHFTQTYPSGPCPECNTYWCPPRSSAGAGVGAPDDTDSRTADFTAFYPSELIPVDHQPCTAWQRHLL